MNSGQLPFLFKVMENLIAIQTNNYLVSNIFLSDKQSGLMNYELGTTLLL